MTGNKNCGSALVEFAVVCSMVFIVLFGLIEMGLLMKDSTILNQAVREGARVAAIGGTPTAIRNQVTASCPTLDTTKLATQVSPPRGGFSTDGGVTWVTLGVSGANNNAPSGSLVKIHVTYQHQWLTNFIFQGSKTMSSVCVVRRE